MNLPTLPCLLALLLGQTPAGAPTPTDVDATASTPDPILRLGGRLSTLRTSVDALAADVGRERAALHDELSALERRRRELEERIALATLTTREFEARLDAARTTQTASSAAMTSAQAPVREAMTRLRHVQARVPFRLHARREHLAAVERSLSGLAAPAAAAALWPLILDEARLLRERGRIRQAIVVDGAPVMAELVHVGPLVWWRAGDGRGGVASIAVEGDAPRFVAVDDPESRQRLTVFFEAQRRGPPTGTWLLPSPLVPASTGPTSAPTTAIAGGTP